MTNRWGHILQQSILSLRNLSKSFDGESVLQPIDLEVKNGEFLTLLGPSGCGKTTLLRLLAGFETPDQGDVYINGECVNKVAPEQRNVNMVFQSYALFPHMTVFDNVAFGLKCQKVPAAEIKRRVTDTLKMVRMLDLATRKPDQLSGGQQQRVAIARAVINEPLVLLLDEPLSALDYHLRYNMQLELKALQRRLGITFVLVTHDQDEALSLSDRVVVMNHGCIEQIGTPRDIYEEPVNLFVAQFIGRANILEKTVLNVTDTMIEVEVAGNHVQFMNSNQYVVGDRVNIVIRPEDLTVWDTHEIENKDRSRYLAGTVSEVIYKGSTVELIVTLTDGQRLSATEFFDDNDDELAYELGESVFIEWQAGWEVVLPAVQGAD
ncbi:MAG: spermidine/putrescine ABC transporter ATP-binding protein PotA [Coxiella sp. (in: Bacteria)]|nr:MAG: spermidine/putrescine ABC transporter ATP-binding protein PotA [Coxiella sp. (in: g-proteobacteria)]